MTDPRIERTRRHVLDTARRVLREKNDTPLTFTTLANEAQVSRRTLYTHWGSIDRVISDAVDVAPTFTDYDPSEHTVRERLEFYFSEVRSTLNEPVTRLALVTLMGQSGRDSSSSDTLEEISQNSFDQFQLIVGPLSRDSFAEFVGPLFLSQFLLQSAASDELIAILVERGLRLIPPAGNPG
jgi:AcrR family transcriptional regulator